MGTILFCKLNGIIVVGNTTYKINHDDIIK
jgi:hypothetical protein